MTSHDRRVIVVTACTGQKADSSASLLRTRDFARGATHIEKHHRRMPDALRRAENLYRGQQHVRLMRGVEAARAAGWEVQVSIVSAGYGVVSGDKLIAPYECTFKGMSAVERRAWGNRLGLREAVQAALATPAELSVVLLGDDYLDACAFGEDLTLGSPALVFCGAGAALRLPPVEGLRCIALHRHDTKRFSCGLVGLKGEIARRLLTRLAAEPHRVARLLKGNLLSDMAAGQLRPVAEAAF